jgi:hypothetical protein
MKLKHTAIKYLVILTTFELVLDILTLLIPSQIQRPGYSGFLVIARAVIFILLLNDLYKGKAKFAVAVFAFLAFPVLTQIIQVCLGNIFIHFCPQQISDNGKKSLLSLFSKFEGKKCHFPVKFYFFPYIEYLFFCIKRFFATRDFGFLWGFLFSPYIIYLFLFFRFCLFKVFEKNNRNPYLSLVPVVNSIILLKTCRLPVYLILILLIPFVRLFYFYRINKQLCEIQNLNKSNAIWMTVFPQIFYGKLVFR